MSHESDLDFTVTLSGIELSASSKDNYWIVKITRDGNIRFLKNMKVIEAFPSTPLTKKLVAATEAIHQKAVNYLTKAWEQGKPTLDDAEGREAWWWMKDKVKSF